MSTNQPSQRPLNAVHLNANKCPNTKQKIQGCSGFFVLQNGHAEVMVNIREILLFLNLCAIYNLII